MEKDNLVKTEIARPDGVSEEAKGDYGFVNGVRFDYKYDTELEIPQLQLDLIKERKRMLRLANAKYKNEEKL